MICKDCLNRACYVTNGKVHAIKWACRVKRISFGSEHEYKSGKNMVSKCGDFKGVGK